MTAKTDFDQRADPIVLDGRQAAMISTCAERARACFATEPLLSEIAVCGTVYVHPDQAAIMSVPHFAWLGARLGAGHDPRDAKFDFRRAVDQSADFAAAAMRFQVAAEPDGRINAIGLVMQAGDAPFVTSILHFARSGRIRLLPGSLVMQRLRFMTIGDRDAADLSGIRPVFTSAPSQHDVIEAQAAIEADLASFSHGRR